MNACSELYVDIINKKLASLDAKDIPSFWKLVSDISRVVMGDAPLLDIFSPSWDRQHANNELMNKKVEKDEEGEGEEHGMIMKEENNEIDDDEQGAEALNQAQTQGEEKEWMWQASLLSLEGSYTVIKKLFVIIDKKDPIIYRVLSELIRLCCHSTTISYEGSQLECIQVYYHNRMNNGIDFGFMYLK